MNKIGLLILLSNLLVNIANADVYVVTNPQNGVYSLSEQNDCVTPKGYTTTIIKGQTISNLPITGSPQLYNFSNGAFVLNSTAVQAQQAQQTAVIASQTAQEQAKASAIAKLTDAISKVATQDVLTQSELQALLPS